ncbi:MAG: alpha/beta fold hydrolase [Chitinispirillaceae bacterium]|nr:alpha/beta fold hydrolase [Chitinispirillaceae bacterium]
MPGPRTARVARFSFVEWRNAGKTLRGSLLVARPKGSPWVVFCHGFTGHRLGPGYLFVQLSRSLGQAGISSLRFDFSGAGESEGRFRDMTVDTMRSDLLSAARLVRERCAPSSLILLGHSLGGMIAALECASIKPDGLVLLSPVADAQGLIKRRKTIMKAGPNAGGFFENGPHEMALAFLDGLKSIDPVAAVAGHFKGKLLLFQGNCDESITVVESARYVHESLKAGIETTYHVIRNADHNFSAVSHFKTLCSTSTSWIKERFR